MLRTLIFKELRNVISGPKFVATFAACTVLLLISVYIGIEEYNQTVQQFHLSQQLADEQLEQAVNWRNVNTREHRTPDPMQIFSSGLHYDIGRWSPVDQEESVKLKNSVYSDDPIFAVFRILDFTVIVQIVFSLFALLFTFDAVNGEKESGTLRLVFANAVPRTRYILAKVIGSWLGLVIPLLVPILISMLMVAAFGISIDGSHWLRIGTLVLVSLVYVSLFVITGVMMSTLTHRTSVSFLLSLVLWIGFVLIIPRIGVMAAGHIAQVPQLAQVDALRDAYAQEQWDSYYTAAEERFRERRPSQEDEPADETEMWATMEFEDSMRTEIKRKIDEHEARLKEDLDNRRRDQQRIGFILSRLSPAAAYQMAAMSLAGTDLTLKSRYEDALTDYRAQFLKYVETKSEGAGPGAGAVMIMMDSEKGLSITTNREGTAIDISDRPRFEAPMFVAAEAYQSAMMDTGLLLLFALLVFSGAFVAFLRFDVR